MTSDQELEQVLDSLNYMLRQCANRERWPRGTRPAALAGGQEGISR
jgi:hypothetical protein